MKKRQLEQKHERQRAREMQRREHREHTAYGDPDAAAGMFAVERT